MEGKAVRVGAIFVTKREGMFAGSIEAEKVATIIGQCREQGIKKIKVLGFKAEKKGYRMIELLMEPEQEYDKSKKESGKASQNNKW